MDPVATWILHAEPGTTAGPIERWVAAARRAIADRHRDGFLAAGAASATVIAGPPDDTPFGARLRRLVERERPAGVIVLGSGAVPLASAADRRALVAAAASAAPIALANNRYSADVVAIPCAERLTALPDLPSDNVLPRWLAEIGGYEVRDLGRRWRLALDVDGPLDLLLLGRAPDDGDGDGDTDVSRARANLRSVAAVARDPRAELLVAGRTSGGTLGWLERGVAARVRVLVEERGLRASSPLAWGGEPSRLRVRPPRSVLGALLDRDGPGAVGARLAELADAAVVDTRVLLAHRFGPSERDWPSPEDRFASDLLLADRVANPWLRALTESAASAPIPVVLGGHTLVGPGLRLLGSRRWS